MAGEEVFTANAVLSIGGAFFFLVIYLFYEVRGLKGFFKPVFFILAVAMVMNGLLGQQIAYDILSQTEASNLVDIILTIISIVLFGIIIISIVEALIFLVDSLAVFLGVKEKTIETTQGQEH